MKYTVNIYTKKGYASTLRLDSRYDLGVTDKESVEPWLRKTGLIKNNQWIEIVLVRE